MERIPRADGDRAVVHVRMGGAGAMSITPVPELERLLGAQNPHDNAERVIHGE